MFAGCLSVRNLASLINNTGITILPEDLRFFKPEIISITLYLSVGIR